MFHCGMTNAAVANRDLGFYTVGNYLKGCAHGTVGGPWRKEGDPAAAPDVDCSTCPAPTRNAPLWRTRVPRAKQHCSSVALKRHPTGHKQRDPSLIFVERLERWALAIACRNPPERARIRLIANI